MSAAALRCAHMSDLHFGPGYLDEAQRCFEHAIDDAIAAGAAVAVLSGDATHHALELQTPAAAALARGVARLADHCPVLILQGTFSHEPPGSLTLFGMLAARHRVHLAERIEQVALLADGSWQASPGWRFDALPAGPVRALFSCVPTVNKACLAASVGAEQADHVMGGHLASLLAGFAPLNAQARARDIPTFGVGHGTVSGCVSEHGVPMAGLDHEFALGALFGAGADAFLLGHIHKHQSWKRGGQLAAYAGSIGRNHYGEQGDKGMLLWDVVPGQAAARLVPTPARRTVDIVFDGAPDLAQLAAAVEREQLAGASVRVMWSVPEQERGKVDRAAILAILGCAAEVKLAGRLLPVQSARAPGISLQRTLEGKAVAWALASGVDPEPLRQCLAALAETGPQDIAATILAEAPALPGSGDRPGALAPGAITVTMGASAMIPTKELT